MNEKSFLLPNNKVGAVQSFQNMTQGVKWSKWIAGLCVVFASIALLISIFVVAQPQPISTEEQLNSAPVLKSTGTGIVANESEESAQDLTIMGVLRQSPETTARDEIGVVKVRRQGKVQAAILKSRLGRDYFAFYQVPYARDPIGDLRFELPSRPKRWRGVRDSTKPGVECIQREKYSPIVITGGAEECLHLNIYTPALPQRRRNELKMPVLFYLHGGEPYGNGTRYGAKYFMDEDVVLVTIEFRLGAMASFTTGTSDFPGNLGFKDQVYALEWVQKNIDRFGGDPDNVMLFGNSGGSAAVNGHLLSPMSQDLFHRAIMESGSVLMGGIFTQSPVDLSKQLATEVGCGDTWNNKTLLLPCLRAIDAKTMALTATNLEMAGGFQDNWDGVTSRRKLRSSVFAPDTPWNLLTNPEARLNKVPLIIGVNSQEFIHGDLTNYLTTENGTEQLNEDWDKIFPPFAGIVDDENGTAANEFREFYFGDDVIDNDTRVCLFDLESDHFVHASRTTGLLYQNQTKAPVYFYWLSKEPAKSYGDAIQKQFPPPYGVAHADELQYLFLYDGYPEITTDSVYFNFSQMMVKLWVSFANEGRPVPPSAEWPPIDQRDKGMKWFQLDDELKMVEPFTERMQLWDKYTERMYGGK